MPKPKKPTKRDAVESLLMDMEAIDSYCLNGLVTSVGLDPIIKDGIPWEVTPVSAYPPKARPTIVKLRLVLPAFAKLWVEAVNELEAIIYVKPPPTPTQPVKGPI